MKFKFTLAFSLIIFALILLPNSSSKTYIFAACDPAPGGHTNATDLITSLTNGDGFSTSSGKCVISGDAVINTTINYATFKSLYYTQSKTLKATITSLPSTIADQTVYLVTGDLTVSGAVPSGGTAVVFVDGQLNINSDFTYGTNTTGVAFIVRGNVNIRKDVTTVNAVIISEGAPTSNYSICTAYDGTCPSTIVSNSSQLVINGSLISLDATHPIKFMRSLPNNSLLPAEQINLQIKYLVILRNILSDTVQRWTEVLPHP